MPQSASFSDEKNGNDGRSLGSVIADKIYRPEVDTSKIDERKLIRKIDIGIIPWLAVLYLLNFLDRGSIGNARVRGTVCLPFFPLTPSAQSSIIYRKILGLSTRNT